METSKNGLVTFQFKYVDYPTQLQDMARLKLTKQAVGPSIGSAQILKRTSDASYTSTGNFDSFIKDVLKHEKDDYFALIRDDKILIGAVDSSNDPFRFGTCTFSDQPMIKTPKSSLRVLSRRGFYRDDFDMTLSVRTVLNMPTQYNNSNIIGYQGKTIQGSAMAHVKAHIES